LVDSDIVITDAGSLIYEAWALGKQVIFPDFLVKKEIMKYLPNTFESYIYEKKLGLHAESEQELISLVNNECGIYLTDKEVIRFIDGIFDVDLRGRSGFVTADYLRKICEGQI
jgi:CDP-glycerol glycerophosphotransferase (TagB/SpsB family)